MVAAGLNGNSDLLPPAIVFATLALLLEIFARRVRTGRGSMGRAVPFSTSRDSQPYNIFRPMDSRVRLRLAFAVFLMFATIGPLSTLMEGAFRLDNPLRIALVTIAAGGISASIILFARHPTILVLAVGLCMIVNTRSDQLGQMIAGLTTRSVPADAQVVLSAVDQEAITHQRTVVGLLGIALVASGYVVFIIVLTQEGRKRVRLEAEVAIARRIQESLLPVGQKIFRWGIAFGRTMSATEVGGDYFDLITLPGGHTVVVIADVTGHGVGAGILSAMTKSALRSQVQRDPSPCAILENLNQTIRQIAGKGIFVTVAVALVSPDGRSAQIATAGHPPVLHRLASGAIETLRTPSMALGMSPSATFSETAASLESGSILALFTDGVIEAATPDGSQFGLERLEHLLHTVGNADLEEATAEILQAVRRHAGGSELRDDATIVLCRVGG
jgi:serine phosphatase RsbU (regulator of sigma subunit)